MKARNSSGGEGLVPENYIRVWNPVDDVGENEVSVDNDDILLGRLALASTDYRFAHSDSKFISQHFIMFNIYADHLIAYNTVK